jgi:hypothetical protein
MAITPDCSALENELAEVLVAITRARSKGESWRQGARAETNNLATLIADRDRLRADLERCRRGGAIRVRQGVPLG